MTELRPVATGRLRTAERCQTVAGASSEAKTAGPARAPSLPASPARKRARPNGRDHFSGRCGGEAPKARWPVAGGEGREAVEPPVSAREETPRRPRRGAGTWTGKLRSGLGERGASRALDRERQRRQQNQHRILEIARTIKMRGGLIKFSGLLIAQDPIPADLRQQASPPTPCRPMCCSIPRLFGRREYDSQITEANSGPEPDPAR
jgi:hypothetical protein